MLNDFFYANSERQDPSEESFNSYYFKSCVINNFGSSSFNAFEDELQEESFIIQIGASIINANNLTALEIDTNHSTFIFYFPNNTRFYCETPKELKDTLKFGALCKIVCGAISEIEKAQKRSILHEVRNETSPLFSLPNFINN